jgi:hypothetical protein
MAEQGADYTRGEMTIDEHERTFGGFIRFAKWGSLYIGSLVLFLTLWFCTGAGFPGAVITVAVVIGVGVLVLGDKRKP